MRGMNNEDHSEIPVLIVGAGAAGLTTAVALARQGVESLLVERRPDLSALPRATSISTRSMELFRSWGLEEEIRAGGTDGEWLMWLCETLAQASAGSALSAGYPTKEQSAVVSPTGPAIVPQDHLEPVLLRHLASLDAGHARFGTALVDVEDRPDGVRAVLRDVATGELRTVHARYLVAADGAHSAARRSLGIEMHGPDNLWEAVTALFRAPLWDLVGDHRYGLYSVAQPEVGGSFFPAGLGDRWLYGRIWEPGAERLADFTEERLKHDIRAGAGSATVRPQIERIGDFTFAAQLAESFRRGNSFLVGDAAHRVTPRGGTGMNTAVHDGYDLGWKLAWVLRGWAGPELLDSYEAERRPVAEHNVARSADPRRLGAGCRGRAARGPRRTHRAHLAAVRDGTGLHPGPAGSRADALHRSPRGALAHGGGAGRRTGATRDEASGRDHRASPWHPGRRRPDGPARWPTGYGSWPAPPSRCRRDR